jgi:hypothetical protein
MAKQIANPTLQTLHMQAMFGRRDPSPTMSYHVLPIAEVHTECVQVQVVSST